MLRWRDAGCKARLQVVKTHLRVVCGSEKIRETWA